MPKLWNQNYSRAQILENVGQISQLASITPFDFTDGPERGTRGLLMRNASGLCLTVHPDRCLDIGEATFNGMPLAWTSATGFPHPAFYEPPGMGWLRSFGGGLVATCGLTNVGAPSDDIYGHAGQHGRIGNTPAYDVSHGGHWHDDQYVLGITGKVREARVFGENLVLTRTLAMDLSEPVFLLQDTVTNEGHEPAPLMLLYHCNFGFPLLSPNTRLDGIASATPRDSEAADGQERALMFEAPTPGYKEKCYWLAPHLDGEGKVTVSLRNPDLNLRLSLRYDPSELPCLTEWKQMGQGTYTVGLEPGNVLPLGRSHYLEQNELPLIAPGESRQFSLEMAIR